MRIILLGKAVCEQFQLAKTSHNRTIFERPNLTGWTALSVVVVMAGLGVGALNEIVEFAATVVMPETGVGGYINTSLDLVADLIGALAALIYIRHDARTTLV